MSLDERRGGVFGLEVGEEAGWMGIEGRMVGGGGEVGGGSVGSSGGRFEIVESFLGRSSKSCHGVGAFEVGAEDQGKEGTGKGEKVSRGNDLYTSTRKDDHSPKSLQINLLILIRVHLSSSKLIITFII